MRPAARGTVAAQPEALDEIVDVGQVIEDPAVTENQEPASRDARETASAAGDRRDRRCRVGRAMTTSTPVLRRRLARDALPFELRDLIDVAGLERRVLVRGRMLDVAVDTDRAAVDDAPGAGARPRLRSTVRTAAALTGAVLVVAQTGLPIDRGDVIDDLDAADAARATRSASRRSPMTGSTPALASRRRAASADSGQTVVAAADECAREVTAGEAGRAGD